MKAIRNLLALFLLTLCTVVHAESISVSPVTLEPGGIVPISVNCSFSCEDITLYQFDLYLPEGVTLAKNNKGRYAAGTTYVLSDRHDEHTARLQDNGGFVRFVVSQNDKYLITPGNGLLLTLYVQADANVSGELQASIKDFMMFETNQTKHAMSDITFNMTVPAANIPVTGISLNKTTATLTSKGQTLQLSATVTPSNATNKSVTWTSSNTQERYMDEQQHRSSHRKQYRFGNSSSKRYSHHYRQVIRRLQQDSHLYGNGKHTIYPICRCCSKGYLRC